MTEPIVLHRYWITDEVTGKRRLTSWHMTADEAAKRYPGAEPEQGSREERVPQAGSAAQLLTKGLK